VDHEKRDGLEHKVERNLVNNAIQAATSTSPGSESPRHRSTSDLDAAESGGEGLGGVEVRMMQMGVASVAEGVLNPMQQQATPKKQQGQQGQEQEQKLGHTSELRSRSVYGSHHHNGSGHGSNSPAHYHNHNHSHSHSHGSHATTNVGGNVYSGLVTNVGSGSGAGSSDAGNNGK
jgi:hypothetical protein